MIGIPEAFSPTYAAARRKFLEAAAAGGLEVESHTHPLAGREGEVLAMTLRANCASAGVLMVGG